MVTHFITGGQGLNMISRVTCFLVYDGNLKLVSCVSYPFTSYTYLQNAWHLCFVCLLDINTENSITGVSPGGWYLCVQVSAPLCKSD